VFTREVWDEKTSLIDAHTSRPLALNSFSFHDLKKTKNILHCSRHIPEVWNFQERHILEVRGVHSGGVGCGMKKLFMIDAHTSRPLALNSFSIYSSVFYNIIDSDEFS
jgi:hypothetical protein